MRKRLKDFDVVYKILLLRSRGVSFLKLGAMFKKHHTTIMDICYKNKVRPGSFVDKKKVVVSVPQRIRDTWLHRKQQPFSADELRRRELLQKQEKEVINTGKKCYEDYLKAAGYKHYYKADYNKKHILK